MLFSYWHKLYQEKELNKELEEENKRLEKELEEENRILKKELQFLKDEMNGKCSKNDKYEIARRYLLGCITFNGGGCSYVRINASELFKIFNIPFDLCIGEYNKRMGKELLMDVELKIEKPCMVMELKDIDVDEVITKEMLDELMKEQNYEKRKDEKDDSQDSN